MGMDILIADLAIAEGGKPDWTAARQALAEMTDEILEDLAFDLHIIDEAPAPASTVRTALSTVIDRVEEAISSGSRELSAIEVPGWLIYLTGGASWGGTPTELFDDFRDLDEAGLSRAAGFYVGEEVEARSGDTQPAETAADRARRYARIVELLEPRLVFGPEFSPLKRYVFLTGGADIDGCYSTLEEARTGFGDRGSEYNPNPAPPTVIDLDATQLELQRVTYDPVDGMNIDYDGLVLEDEGGGEILGASIEERGRLIDGWLDGRL